MMTLRQRLSFAALSGVLLLTTGFTASLCAQSSDTAPSVAEAARRAREQKNNAPKPARTVTDDNLPKPVTGDVNVTGTPAAGADTGAAQPGAGAAAATSPDGAAAKAGAAANPADQETLKQKKAQAAAELEKMKKQLAYAEHELDVLQRKLALDDDAYHSKADYERDTAGRALLDQDGKAISDKQISIEAIKAKIAEWQAIAGEAPADQSVQPN
jgi:hypothetical protein